MIVLIGLKLLIVKVFNRFVIDQAINGTGAGLAVQGD